MTCYICVIVVCSVLPSIKLPGSTFPSWSTHSSIYIHLHRIYDIYIFHIVHDVCMYNTYTYTFTCMHMRMYIYTYIAIFRYICYIYAIYVDTWIYPHIYHLTLWFIHDRICDIGTFPHNSLSTHLSLLLPTHTLTSIYSYRYEPRFPIGEKAHILCATVRNVLEEMTTRARLWSWEQCLVRLSEPEMDQWQVQQLADEKVFANGSINPQHRWLNRKPGVRFCRMLKAQWDAGMVDEGSFWEGCKQKVDCAFSWVLFYLSVGTTGDGARRTARSQACRVVGLCGERDNGGLGPSCDAGAGNGGAGEQGSELRVELEGWAF